MIIVVVDTLAISDAVAGWEVWSAAVERALASAFGMARAPVPPQGLVLEGGRLSSGNVVLGGGKVNKHRPDLDDPANATEVHLCGSSSVCPTSYIQKEVVDSCVSSTEHGSGMLEGLELSVQWSCIVQHCPVGVLDWAHLVIGPTLPLVILLSLFSGW